MAVEMQKTLCGGRSTKNLINPLQMIFGVKVDLWRKYRLVIKVRVVDSYRNKVYVSTMKYISSRILTTIAAANYL